MSFQFPLEYEKQENVFIMTPYEFKITPNRKARKATTDVSRQLNSNERIVLPTPTSGLTINESGNWDELEGYLSLKGEASQLAANAAIEKGGAVSKHFFKGQFVNDYASLSYKGSNFRVYNFSWTLLANSLKEAQMIKSIIELIRRRSLPNYQANDIQNMSGSSYPNMWLISPNLNNELNLTIQDCVITNLTVNYSPDGEMRLFESGHPLSVNLEIEFKELYRADRRDVGE